MSFDANHSAQVALGKFYLHPWEGQVLVDWASSMVEKGFNFEGLKTLAEMEGADRSIVLRQFRKVGNKATISIGLTETEAVTIYIHDLRDRVLANEIDPIAAFNQVRPLAYDTDGFDLPGLSELDEDINLVDSDELPWYNADLTKDTKELVIRRFFRRLRILDRPMPVHAFPERSPRYYQDKELTKYVETVAIVLLTLLLVIYVLLLFAGLM